MSRGLAERLTTMIWSLFLLPLVLPWTSHAIQLKVHGKPTTVRTAQHLQMVTPGPLYVGFDIGTSGVRAIAIDGDKVIRHEDSLRWSSPDKPSEWISAIDSLLQGMPTDVKSRVHGVCVSGTSASCLMVEAQHPLTVSRPPRMYDYNTLSELPANIAQSTFAMLEEMAPPGHTTLGGTSALMKLLCWHAEDPVRPEEAFAHQADYVAGYLREPAGDGSAVITDWNNALKTGFCVEELSWPAWLVESIDGSGISHCLPKVVPPGAPTGSLSREVARRHGLPLECQVVAGTTDSIAAFIAAGVSEYGHAVTSLGSTLAIKMLSETKVDDASRGVYSHRLGGVEGGEGPAKWLVGGASNVGCAVLRSEGFEAPELESLSALIDPTEDTALGQGYYPLTKTGERFPYNEPGKKAILTPKPDSRKEYLHGILQAIARVECEGYAALEELGASKLRTVVTAGGGAVNTVWTQMRARMLGVPTSKASNADAAYGCALLARNGVTQSA